MLQLTLESPHQILANGLALSFQQRTKDNFGYDQALLMDIWLPVKRLSLSIKQLTIGIPSMNEFYSGMTQKFASRGHPFPLKLLFLLKTKQ